MVDGLDVASAASMKALPKRKGNHLTEGHIMAIYDASMKALPKRKGNRNDERVRALSDRSLNESPSKKEGKLADHCPSEPFTRASMKALPKRKGNIFFFLIPHLRFIASMKALPKRKGNHGSAVRAWAGCPVPQ